MIKGSTESSLHVLHIIGDLDLGGAETLLYRLATMPRIGFAHEVVCLSGPGWYSPLLEAQGVEVHHLGITSPLSLASGILRLRDLFRRTRPDVVQSWMYLANVIGGAMARISHIPLVWGIHASSVEHLGRPSRLCAYIGGWTSKWIPNAIVNCSTRSAEYHVGIGYAAETGTVIHNGYDADTFFPDEERRVETRLRLGLTPHTFAIGSIARWHAQKDIPNLLEAVRLLQVRNVPLRCLLIGTGLGPEDEELAKHLSTDLGAITPLGPRSDAQDLARALDLHVLSSAGSEAFPNVVAETMLSGTPNVVTDVGDAAFMVGQTGWAVPPRSPAALADAIELAYQEWRNNKDAWEHRRTAAREAIADRFTFERMARAYEDLWRAVVNRSGH